MWRPGLALTVLAAAAVAGPAQAGSASPPPILYVSGIQCPAHRTCAGVAKYNERIFEIAKVGFPAHALTSAADDDSHPVWSPDHRRIVFLKVSGKGLVYNLWLMNADTSGQRQLTHSAGGVDTEPSWSPDGKRIVFRGNSPDAKTFDLYTIRSDGTGLTRITSNPDGISVTEPDWSPNGRRIAFQRTSYSTGNGSGIYLIDADGSGLKKLTTEGVQPAWSPNGKKIAFARPDPASGGTFEIDVMNAGGAGQVKLTSGAESVAPAWSPGGAQIVFLRGTQITLMNADGTGIKQLTKPLTGSRFVDTPDW